MHPNTIHQVSKLKDNFLYTTMYMYIRKEFMDIKYLLFQHEVQPVELQAGGGAAPLPHHAGNQWIKEPNDIYIYHNLSDSMVTILIFLTL